MSQAEISFIGIGKMASAILQGMIDGKTVEADQVGVFDLHPESMEKFVKQGCKAYSDITSLVKDSKRVILCVKPQNFSDIAPDIKAGMDQDKIIISIMAGIGGRQIQNGVGFPCKVVVGMPNTPMLVGKGATALARVEPTTEEEFQTILHMFPGYVAEVQENQINAVIPVNGSSPAFIYYFAALLADRATENGIDAKVAMELACHTLIGSAEMILQTGYTPQELIDMVCSPGGSTIEGMKALYENGFKEAVERASDACVKRAEELACESDTTVEIAEYHSPRYQEILELREKVLRTPLGLKLTKEDLETDDRATHFAIMRDGELIGAGNVFEVDKDTARIRQVVVNPDSQKFGVGRFTMNAMQNFIKEKGYKRIILEARKESQGFYEKLGYTPEGDYFLYSTIPHIRMYLDL